MFKRIRSWFIKPEHVPIDWSNPYYRDLLQRALDIPKANDGSIINIKRPSKEIIEAGRYE